MLRCPGGRGSEGIRDHGQCWDGEDGDTGRGGWWESSWRSQEGAGSSVRDMGWAGGSPSADPVVTAPPLLSGVVCGCPRCCCARQIPPCSPSPVRIPGEDEPVWRPKEGFGSRCGSCSLPEAFWDRMCWVGLVLRASVWLISLPAALPPSPDEGGALQEALCCLWHPH